MNPVTRPTGKETQVIQTATPTTPTEIQRASPLIGMANEFLSFRLGPEEYAIEILKVQEIRGWEQPTTIANAPRFVKGVINLRGTIVPIIDMRVKFDLGSADYNDFTVVIIVNVRGRTVGIVVDSVSDVLALAPEQLRPPPAGRRRNSRHRHHHGPGDRG